MDKKPSAPPNHRHYPRSHPIPVRPTAAPRPAPRQTAPASGWSRTVPKGRSFPRGA